MVVNTVMGKFEKVVDIQAKRNSGKYLEIWNGFDPSYCAYYYGDKICIGGEPKFSHCYETFLFVRNWTHWWIKEELKKLSDEDKKELLIILERNKSVQDYINGEHNKIIEISDILNLEGAYIIYTTLNNIEILRLLISKNIVEEYKKILDEQDAITKSFMMYI